MIVKQHSIKSREIIQKKKKAILSANNPAEKIVCRNIKSPEWRIFKVIENLPAATPHPKEVKCIHISLI